MRTTLAALAAGVALAACGGGGDSPAPPPTQPSGPACTPAVVTVALLGDSTQWGADGFTKQRADPEPGQLLQTAMDAQFGAGAVVVTNYGVSGSTADMAPHVVADIVVENYGINDEDYKHDINQYHADVAAIGATIIETPLPTLRNSVDAETTWAHAALQPGVATADVFAYVTALPDWQSMISPDKTHPGAAMYALVVPSVLAPVVAQQVAPLRCR